MAPPPRPSRLEERVATALFFALAPRLPRVAPPRPPAHLEPFETVAIPRPGRSGTLAGTWFPAGGDGSPAPRGAVLLLPPWIEWGRAYFHLRGRLEALRAAGYHALTLDFPGFGGSGARQGFYDLDVEDALRWLAKRVAAEGLPRHVWGVSAGGYWAHIAIARAGGVAGACFEDVAVHLIDWVSRMVPAARPIHWLFPRVVPNAYRFLDLRRQAPHLGLRRVAHISGGDDPGVRPEDTRDLAHLAGGEALILPDLGHLEAIKRANEEVITLALRTFAEAEG